MTRVRLVASGAFFLGYLLFQIVYPSLAWFAPGFDKFTWHMYAGQTETPTFAAVFSDGSTREVGDPLRGGKSVRLFSASVDQRRFLPPYLCANWVGATQVIARYPRAGREETITCPSPAR